MASELIRVNFMTHIIRMRDDWVLIYSAAVKVKSIQVSKIIDFHKKYINEAYFINVNLVYIQSLWFNFFDIIFLYNNNKIFFA
jgi:hypothetical protein